MELRRAQYLAANLAIISWLVIARSDWMWSFVYAIPTDWLDLNPVEAFYLPLIITACFIFATTGYALGLISRARSLSAFGNASYAWYAIVPVLNLVLFFRASKGVPKLPKRMSSPQDFIVVTVAVLLLAAAIVMS